MRERERERQLNHRVVNSPQNFGFNKLTMPQNDRTEIPNSSSILKHKTAKSINTAPRIIWSMRPSRKAHPTKKNSELISSQIEMPAH